MPHVSRHTPIKKVSDRTLDLFMECVTAKWSARERRDFFNDLLTPTERIMFSKRLAIIYMLGKGYTIRKIQETLRVSPSTVARLWSEVEKGKYSKIIHRLRTQPQKMESIEWLTSLIPPRHQTKRQYADRLKRLKL